MSLRLTLRALAAALTLSVPSTAPAPAQAPTWHTGDRVEAWNSGAWYAATVIEIGTGSMAGYYKVHYDKYSTPQYIAGKNLRALPSAAAVASAAATQAAALAKGPRLGHYYVRGYANPTAPLPIGELELLPDGRYRAEMNGGKPIGDGTYTYDPASHTVRWLTGPYKTDGYGGEFTVEREGKTHKIRLKYTTVATSSID